jgi:hypothetical protein
MRVRRPEVAEDLVQETLSSANSVPSPEGCNTMGFANYCAVTRSPTLNADNFGSKLDSLLSHAVDADQFQGVTRRLAFLA